MKILLLTIISVLSFGMISHAQEKSAVPLADPYILLDNGIYYAYGTYDPNGIAVWTSTDLLNWTRHHELALHKQNTSENQFYRNLKNNRLLSILVHWFRT